MVSYASTMRKGIKWYRKLGVELLLGTSIVNALVVYKIATKKTVNIRRFRELIAAKLLGLSEDFAVRRNNLGKSLRRACKRCYANKREELERSKVRANLRKPTTFCPSCPGQPQLCSECFNILHRKKFC